MTDSRKIVRVFLASPGDLKEERLAARAVVDEFNQTWADTLGYQVELVGWEDTISAYGRPQALINNDLEKCELFVGMVWKRWGTPPDTSDRFASGFQEEFETSIARRERDGRPEISLYFKDIPKDLLSDPGEQLRKVVDFRNQLISNKTVLFDNFYELAEFRQKFNRCISSYVQKLYSAETSFLGDTKRSLPTTVVASDTTKSGNSNPLTEEGSSFLRTIAERAEAGATDEAFSLAEIARLRLLGNVLGRTGNGEEALGAHDANLLFVDRATMKLGYRERAGLVRSGLENYANYNAPLWHWLSATDAFERDLLPLYTLSESAEAKAGTFHAMRAIGWRPSFEAPWDQDFFEQAWFRPSERSAPKVAALEYLASWGDSSWLPVIAKEVEKEDRQTVQSATNALLRITVREDPDSALPLLNKLQPTTVASDLLQEIFDEGHQVDSNNLVACLDHKCADVRISAIRLLEARRALTDEMLQKLIADTDTSVRFEALQAQRAMGTGVNERDAQQILERPSGQPNALAISQFDLVGHHYFGVFRRELLGQMGDAELEKMEAEDSSIYDREAYLVLCERHFQKRGDELRSAIKDNFKSFFEEAMADWIASYGVAGNTLVEGAKSSEEYLRANLTRKALDVICKHGDSGDLDLVRTTVGSGFILYSPHQIAYFRRFGDWLDVPQIVAAVARPSGEYEGPFLVSQPKRELRYRKAAQTIVTLARDHLDELLSMDIFGRLLSHTILAIPDTRFRELRDETIRALLSSENEEVRKAAALKAGRAQLKKWLRPELDNYVSKKYFYNVVHWLDLAITLPRSQALTAIDGEVRRGWFSEGD
ncbi:MAG: DUF4062 domain-containing protein [Acidobacteriota bacterium]